MRFAGRENGGGDSPRAARNRTIYHAGIERRHEKGPARRIGREHASLLVGSGDVDSHREIGKRDTIGIGGGKRETLHPSRERRPARILRQRQQRRGGNRDTARKHRQCELVIAALGVIDFVRIRTSRRRS